MLKFPGCRGGSNFDTTTVVSQANREKTTKGWANNRGTMAGPLLPRSPFTLCKRTPEALRILNTRRATPVRLFSLSKRGRPPVQVLRNFIGLIAGLAAIFDFQLAIRERERILENFELSAIWIEKYRSKIKSNFLLDLKFINCLFTWGFVKKC